MPTRQELYDRIRSSSKEEVILEEMIRLGFWPREGEVPQDPAEEIRREGELTRQLQELATRDRKLSNVDALKREARQKRLEESRRKRQENKERRLREREERAAAWMQKKLSEIVYLGNEVSNTLNQQESDPTKLAIHQLPAISSVAELAEAMNISVGELRLLAFDRKTATVTHYRRFGIRKKSGEIRPISAPMPRLKRAQEWILAIILESVPLHDAAHGFRRGRSIVTNARPHVGQDVVINVDLKGFFPTITFPRIRGVFRNLGYSGQLATVLALICSEADVDEVVLDGRTYFVARTERRLPQGAPSSPALTNLICRGLDARLSGVAAKYGCTYTRYADDMTFSGSGEVTDHVGRILRQIRYITEQEGFKLHPEKTRVLRSSRRQEVTGLVVNERLGVSRELLRRFRALLFQIERDGPTGKSWGGSSSVMASIEGFANFVTMVDENTGRPLQVKVRAIHEKHGRGTLQKTQRDRWSPAVPVAPLTESETAPQQAEVTGAATTAQQESRPRKKPWWRFW